MYKIIVTWRGGPKWDPSQTSMFNPTKPKSPFEHLFELGYSSIDDVVFYYGQFKDKPIVLEQKAGDPSSDINWITEFSVHTDDAVEAEKVKDDICKIYQDKINQLKDKSSPFQVEIETELLS